jgi:pentatricopeptide repeat protein
MVESRPQLKKNSVDILMRLATPTIQTKDEARKLIDMALLSIGLSNAFYESCNMLISGLARRNPVLAWETFQLVFNLPTNVGSLQKQSSPLPPKFVFESFESLVSTISHPKNLKKLEKADGLHDLFTDMVTFAIDRDLRAPWQLLKSMARYSKTENEIKRSISVLDRVNGMKDISAYVELFLNSANLGNVGLCHQIYDIISAQIDHLSEKDYIRIIMDTTQKGFAQLTWKIYKTGKNMAEKHKGVVEIAIRQGTFMSDPEVKADLLQLITSLTRDDRTDWQIVTFTKATLLLISVHRIAEALNLFQEAEKRYQKIQLLSKAERHRSTDVAYKTLLNAIIHTKAKHGQPLHAVLPHYEEMARLNMPPDLRTYTTLIVSYSSEHPLFANRLLDDMNRYNIQPDSYVYTALMNGYFDSGKIKEACEIINIMRAKKLKISLLTYNTLVAGFSKAGNFKEARSVLNEMRQHNVNPDTVTYNGLLNGYLVRSMWPEANALLGEMKQLHIPRNAATFNTLIRAHTQFEGGDPSQVSKLISEMSASQYNLSPDRNTYNALLNYLCLQRDWNAVVSHLEKWSDPSVKPSLRVDGMSFTIALKAMGDANALDEADRLLDAILKRNISAIKMAAFSSLIRSAGRKHDLERAKRYYEIYSQFGHSSNDALNGSMVSAFASVGDYNGAIDWVNSIMPGAAEGNAFQLEPSNEIERRMFEQPPISRATTYALMLLHARNGSKERVEAVHMQLKRLESFSFQLSKPTHLGEEVNTVMYTDDVAFSDSNLYAVNEANVLLQAYGLLGEWQQSLDIWKSLWKAPQDAGLLVPRSKISVSRPSSFSSLALREMYGVDRITVSVILDALVASRQWDVFASTWSTIRHSGFPLDGNNWLSYAEGLAKKGEEKSALQEMLLADRGMRRDGHEPVAKTFWSLIPLMKDGELVKIAWAVLVSEFPDLEGAVRTKLAGWGKEGGHIPDLDWRPPESLLKQLTE